MKQLSADVGIPADLKGLKLRTAGAWLEMARDLGADVTIPADTQDLLAALRAETGPEGANVVLEAVGIQPTINTALAITRSAGALTLIGNVTPRVEFDLQAIVSREITLYGVCASNGEYADCVDLVASGRIRVDPLISGTARLEDGQEVFDRLYAGAEENIRTLFVFD